MNIPEDRHNRDQRIETLLARSDAMQGLEEWEEAVRCADVLKEPCHMAKETYHTRKEPYGFLCRLAGLEEWEEAVRCADVLKEPYYMAKDTYHTSTLAYPRFVSMCVYVYLFACERAKRALPYGKRDLPYYYSSEPAVCIYVCLFVCGRAKRALPCGKRDLPY